MPFFRASGPKNGSVVAAYRHRTGVEVRHAAGIKSRCGVRWLKSNSGLAGVAAARYGCVLGVYEDLDVRQQRIKAIWEELMRTPRESPRHRVLVTDLLAETAAYLAVIEAARGKRTSDLSD